MSRITFAALAAAGILATLSTASALTVANRDTGEQTVKITNGDKVTEHKIPSLDSVEIACVKECAVELLGGNPGATIKGKDSDEILILNKGLVKGGE